MTKGRKDSRPHQRERSGSQAHSPNGGARESTNGAPTEPPLKEEDAKAAYEKKKQSIIQRTIWTFVMIGGFFTAMFMGHIYIIMVITAIQVISFKEIIGIANVPSRARSLQFTKTLNWYFLGTALYYLEGESIVYYFKHIVLADKVLLPFARNHRFIGFILYILGFVFFVMSLQKGHYKFQFQQFAWTHMALIMIVVQGHFVVNEVFEGMIWFFLPVALVITNLSPKKTVEGFVGGFVFTAIFGVIFTNILSRSSYFICPVNDLGANIWTGLECSPNPVFIPRTYSLPQDILKWTSIINSNIVWTTITVAPVQFHVFALSTFASLIAPFGGFFASGLKRTFNIKDFGDSIPGHGGITDRFDCQFIMGFFAFMYYQSFIAQYKATVGAVVEQAISGLTPEEQMEVVKSLSKHLVNQGVMTSELNLSDDDDYRNLPAWRLGVLFELQYGDPFEQVSWKQMSKLK
ncbi:MAG: hypothetical protein M1831_000329 [Alyxoria varia]|nr:MAG: hypothetical protein M1831_000329 [Alyxoria varia]